MNSENKLVKVEKPGMVVEYIYDTLGRRMRKTVNGLATEFRYDKEKLVMEINGDDSIKCLVLFISPFNCTK